jgi:predicted alpha/beta hydrolase family esterase
MDVLILHGYLGNSPEHWQTWLAGRLEGARYPELPDPEHPRLDAWLEALDALRPKDEHLVVCHSLSCLLWLHHLARGGRPARALLVAPPCAVVGPEIASFFPAPTDVAHAPGSRLVCSDDDPFCPEGNGARYAHGLPVDLLTGQGHLNATAGYGPWPEVEAWCRGQDSAITSSRIAPG